MTDYVDLQTISSLQVEIMRFVDTWARQQKRPIPRKEIVIAMKEIGVSQYAVKNALFGLLNQGYLREAILGADDALNHTFYVQLKKVK